MSVSTVNLDNGVPEDPQISVLMAAYNSERFLEPAVRSVLGQTFTDFEYVIVDDGSTDRTGAMLDAFAAEDPRVKVLHRPNSGIPKSVNAGLAVCRAPFIARFDADDVMLPHRLARQLRFMQEHPQVVAAGSAVEMIDEKDRFIHRLEPPCDDAGVQDKLEHGHCSICQPACILRAEAVRQLGGYDEYFAMAQDRDLFLRLGEVGRLANMPDVLTRYRRYRGWA